MTVPEHPIDTPPRAPSPVHRFGTLAVHAGSPHDPVTGAVIEPVRTADSLSEGRVADRGRSRCRQHLRKPPLGSQ
ncbi:hypothetical protein IG631_14798 [Alternaria alternata]|nr:hypothetical protein IG631_14798 [Alternaria alternata]